MQQCVVNLRASWRVFYGMGQMTKGDCIGLNGHIYVYRKFWVVSVLQILVFRAGLVGKMDLEVRKRHDGLWQQIISGKYNYASNCLIPPYRSPNRFSWIWNGVLNSFYKEDNVGVCLRSNFILQLGDGKSIAF
ncbi:hypothetical protein V6N12_010369 [Hibiscus sabdariffa]|uniref:Uncharacterized protein n=1 Tax=Hibiscus sabdariffa TaxID=183260 RepID=A0ABR2EJW5_9ROSI